MLYRFDPTARSLDRLVPADVYAFGVQEKEIEQAVANHPDAIFKSGAAGDPVLVVRTSVAGRKMPDIIALDGEGRLVLVECKRGWADRDALAQLLDYAADYKADPIGLLNRDWGFGRGRGKPGALIDHFRAFIDDAGFREEDLGREHVLVVVATGEAPGFSKIRDYLSSCGVPVYLIAVKLYRRDGGELYVDVEPVDLAPSGEKPVPAAGDTAWMINTDETHSPGAWKRFLEHGVAGIWGYPTFGATLDQGAQAGDTIYAYQNGRGIIATGKIEDAAIRPASESGVSVFPECKDGNEWHLAVEWTPVPGGRAVSNRDVREAAGAGLPVRNTFCRLWNPKVREYLASRWAVTGPSPTTP